jgi:GMP synthase-like glutamine amidotransferase
LCCRSLEKVQRVLLTHGDSIEKVADNFRVVAASGSFPSSIANDKLRLYGVQFHPEVGVFVLLSTVSVNRYTSYFLRKATNLLSSDIFIGHFPSCSPVDS